MERTPSGTSVGVDDPYEHAGRCDHLTDDGRCRLAMAHAETDPEFARERRAEGYDCIVADDPPAGGTVPEDAIAWADCPHYRYRARNDECTRCGIEERRMAHSGERPLLEEHHLSYADGDATSHEITVHLCRWCHAKVHDSWARIDDDASPDPEALAEREGRRSREHAELGFESASERYDADCESN